jgi:hypothetical protein
VIQAALESPARSRAAQEQAEERPLAG